MRFAKIGAWVPSDQLSAIIQGEERGRVNALILGVIFYLRNPGRDSIDQKEHRMSGTDDKPIPGEPPQTPDLLKPEAAHWLWRQWYAKSWWTAAAIFWLIAFFAPNLALNAEHITPIILLFHPFLIVPVLGFGFFRAWIRYHFEVKAEH